MAKPLKRNSGRGDDLEGTTGKRAMARERVLVIDAGA
jgi:hypothetical protein